MFKCVDRLLESLEAAQLVLVAAQLKELAELAKAHDVPLRDTSPGYQITVVERCFGQPLFPGEVRWKFGLRFGSR